MKFPGLFRRDAEPAKPLVPQTTSLRDKLVEAHGPLLGAVLYDTQVANQAQVARRLTELQKQLDEANTLLNTKHVELNARLPPLRKAMDAAYEVYLDACAQHEAEQIRIQQEVSPLQQRVYDIQAEIRGPMLHSDRVTNWQRPDWYRPEQG